MKWNILVASMVLGVGLAGQSFGFELLDRMLGYGGSGCDSCCKTRCGCEAKPACGCEAKPAGCEAKPACGCEAKPACGCEAKPACGCEAKPACGCDNGCNKGCGRSSCCRRGLLDHLFSCHSCNSCGSKCGNGCEAKPACGCEAKPACGCEAKPACGCDNGCNKGCGSSCCRRSLLDEIFRVRCCGSACRSCGTKCGCEAKGCEAKPACGCEAKPACGCDAKPMGAHPTNAGDNNATPAPPQPIVDPSAYIPAERRLVTSR